MTEAFYFFTYCAVILVAFAILAFFSGPEDPDGLA